MKYRIVYPDGYSTSACYLIGYDENGKPIYRRNSTNQPKQYSEREKAEMRAFFASMVSAFGSIKL